MDDSHDASRIWVTNPGKARADHLGRYRFAASRLKGLFVLDAACGCGYGSQVLHEAGNRVIGLDIDGPAIAWAERHFPAVHFMRQDVLDYAPTMYDAVVCFETIEHIRDAEKVLRNFRALGQMICSVPNENVIHFEARLFAGDEYPHLRHYTPEQFEALLSAAGWRVAERYTQQGKTGPVVPGTDGRTLVYVCE